MIWTKSATAITVNGTIYPLPTQWQKKQNVFKFENGSVAVYDRGKLEVFYRLQLAANSNYATIRNFIRNTIVFRKYSFTVTPDAGVDLGYGDGVDTPVRYWSDNLDDENIGYGSRRYEIILRFGQ